MRERKRSRIAQLRENVRREKGRKSRQIHDSDETFNIS